MSDRLDYFYRMRVSEAELDLGFELLERADRNLAADIGLFGVVSGAQPAPHAPLPDLTIDLTAPARAYDRLGQRIFFGTGQRVDCAVDSSGIPTDVLTAGRERWLGIFLRFERLLSDPRTDGNSQQVYFRRDESFVLVVRQGPDADAGTAPRVPLVADEVLVCDVLRRQGQTQISASDLDTSRRQAFVFARGDAVEIVSALWRAIAPTVSTVQAALDSVDALLADHFAGTASRHPASHIDATPRRFVSATNVQGALDQVVDGLSSAAAGTPGASLIGADAVAGIPNALPASNVDVQLSQLLGFLNTHVGAISDAHHASAIRATAHNNIAATNVQAQLQEIATDLSATTAGTVGATLVGVDTVVGFPNTLAAGTVRAAIATLLGYINTHLIQAVGAHSASAISIVDAGNNLIAADVELAIAEILNAFEGDHFRGNEPNAGQHRAIRQPQFPGPRALLWDAAGIGNVAGHFRVYIDESVWFTFNASWNGTAWARDSTSFFSGAFRLSQNDLEFLQDDLLASTFTTWSRSWRLPMDSTTNSAFELTGSMQEIGRVGLEYTNASNVMRNLAGGGVVTFRNRFSATPSSISFTQRDVSTGFVGAPGPFSPTRDGFGFFTYQDIAPLGTVFWFGSYTAIA